MIINITQHCTLRCAHCMQCAGPERTEYMSRETFSQALQFSQDIKSRVISMSGGEPTSHPLFFEFLEEALKLEDCIITVLSNGTFLSDVQFVERFSRMVKDKNDFFLHISSFQGLYANYDYVHKPQLKALKMFGDKIMLSDSSSDMKIIPLGRASTGKYYEEASKVKCFPSCTNPCLIICQTEHIEEIGIGRVLELHFKFCLPMVSWDGSIRLGEGEQCPPVANISKPLPEIYRKMKSFRPCGECDSYKWRLENPVNETEKAVCKIFWPDRF